MKINPNKKPDYFCVATSFLMTTTLHAAGVPPISITLSSGVDTNNISVHKGQQVVVEYKIQDVIGKAPSRTWLWASPATSYISRVNSLHAPDCSTYNQPNSDPNSFMLPPSGVCYFALQVNGTQFANTSPTNTVTYRPVFSNSDTIEYGPCLSEQLHITLNPTIYPIISVGTYFDGTRERPLLALSQDIGESWSFPEVINAPVFTPTPPPSERFRDFGVFFGASCNSSLCIAVGKGEDVSIHNRPLLALSKDAGGTWLYPQPVNDPIFTPSIPPAVPFQPATTSFLSAASCNDSFCFAVGSYKGNRRPLLTYTPDLGNSWIYPGDVTNPVFTPDNVSHPYLENGYFNSASCSNSVCVAVGVYNTSNGTLTRPLLVQSQDSGGNWVYPSSTNAPSLAPDTYDNNGTLNSVSCTGTTCVAVGSYDSAGPVRRALLAVTHDSGSNWSYNNDVTTPIFTPASGNAFDNLGIFNSVSCVGTTCVAGGSYSDGTIQRPLLAVSQDSGNSWVFPFSITAPNFTPGNPFPFDVDGEFNSVSCTSSICIAVGSYVDAAAVRRPLLAQSMDFGVTWAYPASITAPVFTPNNTYPFATNGVFNSAKCNENICIASGTYVDFTAVTAPLTAISKDQGVTWEYSEAISAVYFSPNNNNPFIDNGIFFGIGASQNGALLPNSLKFLKTNVASELAGVVPLRRSSR